MSESRHGHDARSIFVCRNKQIRFHSVVDSEFLFVCHLGMWNSAPLIATW
jgi:hypothetical protein